MESEWIFGRWGRTPPSPPHLSPLCVVGGDSEKGDKSDEKGDDEDEVGGSGDVYK